MEINYEVIGNRIRQVRTAKGWTQARLAEYSDVEPTYISHIERGATKLSLPTLIRIANALEASLDELVYSNLTKSAHISVGIIEQLIDDCTADEISAIAEVIKTTKSVLRTKK